MLRPLACKQANPPTMLADFIDELSASWDIHRLEEFFIPMNIEVIRSIPVNTTPFADFWAW
jgi:hypothetical protein